MRRILMPSTSMIAAIAALIALQPTPAGAKPPSNVPGAEPYQTMVSQNLPSGSNGSNVWSVDPVPADRRLVIEFVSVRMFVPTGQKPLLSLMGVVNGAGMPFALPLTYVGTTVIGDEYRGTHQVRVYHDGNGTGGPGIDCLRDVRDQGPATCSAFISGYLIGK